MGETTDLFLTIAAAETTAPAPGSETTDELQDAVTQEGLATALKIVVVILLILLFQGMRVRFQRQLERTRQPRTKPWEK